MLANFAYYEITFRKHEEPNKIYVSGEIKNNTELNYAVALFRIVLFAQNSVVANSIIKIAGLGTGKAKPFEVTVEGISEAQLTRITRWEIMFESGY